MPFFCICLKSSIVFSFPPVLTYFASLLFHEKMSICTVPGAIAATSAATHGGFLRSLSHSASCVFLCLKSGYLAFTFFGLQSHHCEGSEKNSRQTFSLWPDAACPTCPLQEETRVLWPQLAISPEQRDSRVTRCRIAITTKNR